MRLSAAIAGRVSYHLPRSGCGRVVINVLARERCSRAHEAAQSEEDDSRRSRRPLPFRPRDSRKRKSGHWPAACPQPFRWGSLPPLESAYRHFCFAPARAQTREHDKLVLGPVVLLPSERPPVGRRYASYHAKRNSRFRAHADRVAQAEVLATERQQDAAAMRQASAARSLPDEGTRAVLSVRGCEAVWRSRPQSQ
jgi:hypothetical protein